MLRSKIARLEAALPGRSTLALIFGILLGGCQGPSWIDHECIKGRLSAQQAEAVSRGPWGHLPHYNRDADGECKDCPAAEDRILAAKCSDFVKEWVP
jgi:hypothetical protein